MSIYQDSYLAEVQGLIKYFFCFILPNQTIYISDIETGPLVHSASSPKPNFYGLNKYDKFILEKGKNYNKKSCMPFFLKPKVQLFITFCIGQELLHGRMNDLS